MKQVATADSKLPLLISASESAALCEISVRQWWRWDSEGAVPRAARIGRTKRWRLDELERWCAAGCPRRAEWEVQDA